MNPTACQRATERSVAIYWATTWATCWLLFAACAIGAEPESASPPADEPPAAARQLLEAGRVRWNFYDPDADRRRYPGKTTFNLHAAHKHRLKFDVEQRGEQRFAVVRQELGALEFTLEHVIDLPKSYDVPHRWERELVKHELDHVAISTDPRPRQLVRHLYEQSTTVERPLEKDEKLDGKLAQKIINDYLHARLYAVVELMNANNRLLDRVTNHGNRPLAEREAFFERLYTKANLDEHEFPYTGEVLELLKSKAYRRQEATPAAVKP